MLTSSVPVLSFASVPVQPKKVDSIYNTAEYAAWREAVIKRANGACEDNECVAPLAPGRRYADHIKELRDGGAPFDLNNGKCRCASCHTRKTLRERAARLRA